MKLSKLASISLTSVAVVVFLFGVMVAQSMAQTTATVVGTDEAGEVTI
jgi:hypothetical protein